MLQLPIHNKYFKTHLLGLFSLLFPFKSANRCNGFDNTYIIGPYNRLVKIKT